MPLTPSQFVERWRAASLSECSGAQSHFIDLCEMLGQPHPAAADGIGERFTFEKPVSKVYGGYGFADVCAAITMPGSTKRAEVRSTRISRQPTNSSTLPLEKTDPNNDGGEFMGLELDFDTE